MWSNYPEAWIKGSFNTYFLNTLLYTFVIVFVLLMGIGITVLMLGDDSDRMVEARAEKLGEGVPMFSLTCAAVAYYRRYRRLHGK